MLKPNVNKTIDKIDKMLRSPSLRRKILAAKDNNSESGKSDSGTPRGSSPPLCAPMSAPTLSPGGSRRNSEDDAEISGGAAAAASITKSASVSAAAPAQTSPSKPSNPLGPIKKGLKHHLSFRKHKDKDKIGPVIRVSRPDEPDSEHKVERVEVEHEVAVAEVVHCSSIPAEKDLDAYKPAKTFKDIDDVGQLKVTLVSASGLRAADFGGTSDPFAVVTLDDVKFTSETIKKTLNPEWNEEFLFQVADIGSLLHVTVFDRDRFHEAEHLGSVAVQLVQIPDLIRQHRLELEKAEKELTKQRETEEKEAATTASDSPPVTRPRLRSNVVRDPSQITFALKNKRLFLGLL